MPPALSDITRRGIADLLKLRQSPLGLDRVLKDWTGHTFGSLVRLHGQQHELPLIPTSGEFVAIAYTHPDVHVANMLGCQLAGEDFAEQAVIGVTGHGTGTVHEMFSLLATTDYRDRRGRLWIVDQESPFPLGASADREGSDLVCTIDINHEDATWQYLGTTVEEVHSAETLSRNLIDAWERKMMVCPGAPAFSTSRIVDIDADLGMQWTSSIAVLTPSESSNREMVLNT